LSRFVVERHHGGGLRKGWHALTDAAAGVDGGADAVVGGAQDPAAVFGGAHADDFEMLGVRGAVSEVAIVGQIY